MRVFLSLFHNRFRYLAWSPPNTIQFSSIDRIQFMIIFSIKGTRNQLTTGDDNHGQHQILPTWHNTDPDSDCGCGSTRDLGGFRVGYHHNDRHRCIVYRSHDQEIRHAMQTQWSSVYEWWFFWLAVCEKTGIQDLASAILAIFPGKAGEFI